MPFSCGKINFFGYSVFKTNKYCKKTIWMIICNGNPLDYELYNTVSYSWFRRRIAVKMHLGRVGKISGTLIQCFNTRFLKSQFIISIRSHIY